MNNYQVYKQMPAIRNHDSEELDYHANLVPVFEIEAEDGAKAIAAAKKRPVFSMGSGLGRFPIVEVKYGK